VIKEGKEKGKNRTKRKQKKGKGKEEQVGSIQVSLMMQIMKVMRKQRIKKE
jgi:hypothetical protein